MASLFSTTFRIRAATGGNRLLYFAGRLPLVGRLVPESAYAAGGLKTGFTAAYAVLRELGGLLGKALYVMLMVLLAGELLATGDIRFTFGGGLPRMAHILFWLSCFTPFISDSQVMKASKDKYICIKQMRADPRAYTTATVPVTYAIFFAAYLPALLLGSLLSGGGVAGALQLWLMLVAFRFAAEAFQLWWFGRFRFALFRKTAPVILAYLLALAAAYLPVALGWPLYPAGLLMTWPGLGFMALLLAGSLWYVFFGYGNWQRAVRENLKLEYVVPNQAAQRQALFRDVQMREEDLAASPRQSKSIQRKKGYPYLNALFFSRHRRLLFRPVVIRLIIIGAVFAGLAAALLAAPGPVGGVMRQLPRTLPVFVLVMYWLSVAGKACRAMFYNCDNSMLRYAFYRQPAVILENFRIRLLRVVGHNLLVGLAICLAAGALTAMAGGAVAELGFLAFCLSILLLSVFFSVHHLFMYYVFQPYSTERDVANPFYRIASMVVYAASFASSQVGVAGMGFTLGVLGVTLGYTAVALVCIYRFSPKMFRVK